MFWGKTVIWGYNNSLELRGKAEAVVLTVWPRSRSYTESASMEVVEYREPGAIGISRFVEAEGEFVNRIKFYVFPLDSSIIADWDGEARVRGASDGTVAIDSKNASAFFDLDRSGASVGHGGDC